MSNTFSVLKKASIYTAIGFFSLSALIGIIAVLTMGEDNGLSVRTCATAAIAGLASLLLLNAVVVAERKPGIVRIAAMLSAVLHFIWAIGLIVLIWDMFNYFYCQGQYSYGCGSAAYSAIEVVIQIALTAALLGIFATVFANMFAIKRPSSVLRVFRAITGSSLGFLVMYLLPGVWLRNGEYIADTWQLVVVAVITFVFSGVMTAIIAIIWRSRSKKFDTPQQEASSSIDEQALRKKIEAEIRAEIEAEKSNS